MPSTIIRSNQFITKSWGGGTTMELMIYPSESSYSEKDFEYRISIATIEESPSKFTPLINVARTTLILDGEIDLIHEGRYSKNLKQFEQDSYEGGWETSSTGICKDFNLMLRGKAKGILEVFHFSKGEPFTKTIASNHMLIYVITGELKVDGKDVYKNDLVKLSIGSSIGIVENSSIVVCEIFNL